MWFRKPSYHLFASANGWFFSLFTHGSPMSTAPGKGWNFLNISAMRMGSVTSLVGSWSILTVKKYLPLLSDMLELPGNLNGVLERPLFLPGSSIGFLSV